MVWACGKNGKVWHGINFAALSTIPGVIGIHAVTNVAIGDVVIADRATSKTS